MTDADSQEDELQAVRERVRDALEARPDVDDFEIQPAEITGVIVAVQSGTETEYYHVTLERQPNSKPKLHWATLGDEADADRSG